MRTFGIGHRSNYPLQPHTFDDLVFLIFQHGMLEDGKIRSTLLPIILWLVFILAASLVLYALRLIRNRLANATNNAVSPDHFLGSFVESMGVFLGVAFNRLGHSRAERWFLISFSIFGLIYKIHYTDNLFITRMDSSSNRIITIDQLFRTNMPITADTRLTESLAPLRIGIKA